MTYKIMVLTKNILGFAKFLSIVLAVFLISFISFLLRARNYAKEIPQEKRTFLGPIENCLEDKKRFDRLLKTNPKKVDISLFNQIIMDPIINGCKSLKKLGEENKL